MTDTAWPEGLYSYERKVYPGDLPRTLGETEVYSTHERELVEIGVTNVWLAKFGQCARCGEDVAGKRVRAIVYRNGPNKIICATCFTTAEWLDAVNRGRIMDLSRRSR